MVETTAVASKLKVFISYSRKDEDFAQELLAGLELAGFEPYLDKHDIAPGEDWEARLDRLIVAADTVVFVISPDAIGSDRCAWEVNRTVERKKRILPIVWRRVDEAQVPPRLKQLNYIFFDRPLMFVPSLQTLATALKTDIAWIREHTRIGEAAIRWDARGRAEALLPRGEELAATQDWLKAQPKYAPEPTLLHHEFIKAGEDAEAARASAERQRLDQMAAVQGEREKALVREKAALRQLRTISAAGGMLVAILVGLIGWFSLDYFKRPWFWLANMRGHTLTPDQVQALKAGDSFRECASSPGKDAQAPGFAQYSIHCPEMVVIPAGTFMMGSPSDHGDKVERPQHEVTIAKPFAVSRFEVSAEHWQTCVTYGDCAPGSGTGKDPASSVSWERAKVYVAWLSQLTGQNYRLLSEAEWEFAARAGSSTAYAWGDDIGKGNANCARCGSKFDDRTAPVGSFKPNAFGLYDMHGSVWEWVEDPWHDTYDGAPNDGSAWLQGGEEHRRVMRGGAWMSNPDSLRAAFRGRNSADIGNYNTGFRVARTL